MPQVVQTQATVGNSQMNTQTTISQQTTEQRTTTAGPVEEGEDTDHFQNTGENTVRKTNKQND